MLNGRQFVQTSTALLPRRVLADLGIGKSTSARRLHSLGIIGPSFPCRLSSGP
jgi:hypothetical protein